MLDQFTIAIHSRLTTDASLIATVPAENIGNHIKDDETFPHIDWRLSGVVDGGDKPAESYAGELVLEVFSDYRGDLECYQIQSLIYDALATPLIVTGADNYHLRFESIEVSTEGDNRTRQATITYSFQLGEQ